MKRLLASALWFYAAWYAGSPSRLMLGVPDVIGPVVGLTAGLIVGLDPRHVIWNRTSPVTASPPPDRTQLSDAAGGSAGRPIVNAAPNPAVFEPGSIVSNPVAKSFAPAVAGSSSSSPPIARQSSRET